MKRYKFTVIYEAPIAQKVSNFLKKADIFKNDTSVVTADIVSFTYAGKKSDVEIKEMIKKSFELAGDIVHSVDGISYEEI